LTRRQNLLLAAAILAHASVAAGGGWTLATRLPGLISPPPEPLPEEPLSRSEIEEARGRADGEREARADLARGALGWRTYGGYGLTLPEDYEKVAMVDILADDFGVVIKHEGGEGCVVPRDKLYQIARRTAYNDLMLPELAKRHGEDVLDRAQKRADSINAERRSKYEERQRQCKAGKGPGCERISRVRPTFVPPSP
jgi:hypothetical protein